MGGSQHSPEKVLGYPFDDSLEKQEVKQIAPTLTSSEQRGWEGQGKVFAEVWAWEENNFFLNLGPGLLQGAFGKAGQFPEPQCPHL